MLGFHGNNHHLITVSDHLEFKNSIYHATKTPGHSEERQVIHFVLPASDCDNLPNHKRNDFILKCTVQMENEL